MDENSLQPLHLKIVKPLPWPVLALLKDMDMPVNTLESLPPGYDGE